MTNKSNKARGQSTPRPPNRPGGRQASNRNQALLGVCSATVQVDGSVTAVGISLANFTKLKEKSVGKHEFRLSSVSVSISAATKLANDGDLVASMAIKDWRPASQQAMMNAGASFRHVTAQPWGVGSLASSDWVNISNDNGVIFISGFGLAKVTTVALTLRGSIQFR